MHVSALGGFGCTFPDLSAHRCDSTEVWGGCVHLVNVTESLFQVEIYSDQDYFHIFIDENKILQYKHRQKQLSSITKLQILNDIEISSVEITKRGLY